MQIIRKHRTMTGTLLLSAVLVSLTACHHWVPLAEPLGQAVMEKEPGTARVWTADTSWILQSPAIRGDTLSGMSDGSGGAPREVAIPLSDVRRIEERKTQVLKTIFLVYGIAAVVWLAVCVAGVNCLGTIVD